MTNGQLKSDFGSTNMTINCNDAGGWHLTAVGTGADASDKTVMNATSTGTDIATGTATSGNTSNWAMKVTGTGASGFTTFQPIPSVVTNVAGDSNPVANATLNTTYQVFISSTQQADTYTGQVTYTLAHPYEEAPPPLYMQDVDTWGSSLQSGNEITVKDRRDGKSYTVARLADGNIWMTQNLDHDIGSIPGGKYTSNDTDLPSGTEWTPTGSELTKQTNDTTWDTTSTGNTTPQSYDPGTLYWNGVVRPTDQTTCIDYGGTWHNEYGGFCSGENLTSITGSSHYHLGNYYNWTAAIAMSDSSGYETQYDDVDQSICPAGWTLPKGGNQTGTGSFSYLVNQASLAAGTTGNIHTTPNWFVYGGSWGGILNDVGGGGHYWSSVAYSGNGAYDLSLYVGGNLYPQGSHARTAGYSVRCVVRPE